MKLKLIIFLLIPSTTFGLSVDEWLSKYNRPCKSVSQGQVCKERLNSALVRMKNSVVPEIFKRNGLPIWLSTIGIIESEYNKFAVSKAGARGNLQVMPVNVQTYYTKKRIITIPMRTGNGIKLVETIIETKPTIEACKKLAHDTDINATVAAWLLNRLYQKYNDWTLTLQAYNAGEGRIDNYLKGKGKPLTFETLNYETQISAIQKYIEGIR
jgi:hypothetical protein